VFRIAPLTIVAAVGLGAALTGCGSEASTVTPAVAPGAGAQASQSDASIETPTGLATVAPSDAAAVIDPAAGEVVVLDIRTPEEYDEGHLEGAVLVDFYEPDFVEQLDALDRDTPYVLYCRSGNRTSQTLPVMEQLGFRSVTEVGGGILAWQADGLPVSGR
jgi:phage shock protein E